MAQRRHGGQGSKEHGPDEPYRTHRQLGENESRDDAGREGADRFPERVRVEDHQGERPEPHRAERFPSADHRGYGSERGGDEGAGRESGAGWGPEGHVRDGYGRPEHGAAGSSRESRDPESLEQGGFAGFGGFEGHNERGLAGWQGPGGLGEQRHGGLGDLSESARGGEPESPLGEHRRHGRSAAQADPSPSDSGRGWRRQIRGGAEEAQAGSFAGRGPMGYQRSDERIRDDVCERLMVDPGIDASAMTVEVKDGEVTEGTVADRSAKRAAQELADEVLGVKQVHNRLRVRGHEEAST